MSTRKIVFDNLDNAKSNAPELFDLPPRKIAEDLICCASDCEDFMPSEIIPHINEYISLSK